MAEFKVGSVIDGDTFEVSGGWQWNGQTGERVRPTGYIGEDWVFFKDSLSEYQCLLVEKGVPKTRCL